MASDLVKATGEYRPALDLLLGQVLIVRDRAAARRVLAGQPKYTRAVTLRGEVFHATGQVSAGKPVKAAALGRPRQRRELQERLATVAHQIEKLDSELNKLSIQSETYPGGSCDSIRIKLGKSVPGWNLPGMPSDRRRSREESARRQWDWQVSQKISIEAEITQAGKEIEQSTAALSINEKETLQAQEAITDTICETGGPDHG